jgi:cell division protein FtsB
MGTRIYNKTKSKSKSKSKNKIKNLILTFFLLGIIIFLSFQIFGIYKIKYERELEKQALLKQVEKIKQDTVSLEKIKEYISTSAYQEREAKQKLDLKKPGEEVVMITPGSITANLSNEELISILRNPKSEERIPAQTNPERWWAFFFDKDRL